MQHLSETQTNSSVHRLMNERTRRREPTRSASMLCECECHRSECASTFRVTKGGYEAVRAHDRFFLVLSGHQGDDELVVARHRGYLVIQKRGAAGRSAALLDPRG